MLCSNSVVYNSRQEALLSDEEAQEVVRLLSPTDKTDKTEPDWLSEVFSAPSSLMNDSLMTVDSVTTVDSSCSHMTDSVTGSESGIIGKLQNFNAIIGVFRYSKSKDTKIGEVQISRFLRM